MTGIDVGTLLEIGILILVVGGVVLFMRKSPEKQAKILGNVADAGVDAVAALKDTAERAIDRLHNSVPAVTRTPVVASTTSNMPAPAVAAAAETKLGTTDPNWTAPPAPWPIDARYLSPAQIASLTPEQTGRANMWQQALMSAAMTGNGANPVPAALHIYRAGFTKTEDLSKPLDETWAKIFAVYQVPPPALQPEGTWDHMKNIPRPSEAAYDFRLQK